MNDSKPAESYPLSSPLPSELPSPGMVPPAELTSHIDFDINDKYTDNDSSMLKDDAYSLFVLLIDATPDPRFEIPPPTLVIALSVSFADTLVSTQPHQ